jgi:hypothetical protein
MMGSVVRGSLIIAQHLEEWRVMMSFKKREQADHVMIGSGDAMNLRWTAGDCGEEC